MSVFTPSTSRSGGVGVIDVRSCKLAAQAVAGISVLTTKWLSRQGVSL